MNYFSEPLPVSDSLPTAIMDQVDMQFLPKVLVVKQSQKVSFPNSDDIRHHVYSFSKAKTFELKLYRGRDIQDITMDTSGFIELGCNIHDDMLAYIYVTNDEYAVKTDQAGAAHFASTWAANKPAPSNVTVWHPSIDTKSKRVNLPLKQVSEFVYSVSLDVSLRDAVESTRGFTPKF